MARRKSPVLTETELRLMNVLWRKGKASVGEVVEALSGEGASPAYSTVLTMLRVLRQKGLARHEKEGRAFIYYPAVDRGEVRKNTLRYFLSRFFDNSPETLVLNLIEHEDLDSADLARLQALLAEQDKDSG